jgi:hypothetical protein
MLGFGEKPLIVRGVEPKLSTVTHWTEAKFIQRNSSKGTVNIRGTNRRFCVRVPRPSSTPLRESQSRFLRLRPFLKPIGEFLRRTKETRVEGGADSFWKSVGIRPRIKQPQPITKAKLAGSDFFHKPLTDQMLDNARD